MDQQPRNIKIRLRFIAIFLIVLDVFLTSFIIHNSRTLTISLNHNNHIIVGEDNNYSHDKNETATFCILFLCYDVSDQLYFEDNFNTNKIGVYNNIISADYLGLHAEQKWTLEVADTTAPTINLVGDSEIQLYVGNDFVDPGVEVEDNYDTDLSKNVIIASNFNSNKAGKYRIKYSVSDSANNTSFITRKIIVREPAALNHGTNQNNNEDDNRISFYEKLEEYILDNNLDVAIGYYDLINNNQYTYNADKIFYGASLVKTVGAMYAYDKNILNSNTRTLAKKSISVSDNNAHMQLINNLGRDNVMNYGRSLGAEHYMTGTSSYYYGDTTVDDQLKIWKYLWENIDQMEDGEELKSYFKNTFYNNIQAGCDIETMHKYGWYGNAFHDVGIVLNDDAPYILVILTNEAWRGQKVIRDISKIVYEN